MKRTDRRRRGADDHRHHRDAEKWARDLRRADQVAVREVEVGTVVLAEIPYRDTEGSKARPAVVVGRDGDGFVVRALTTKQPWDDTGFTLIEPTWKNGITRRSWLRPYTCTVELGSIRAIRGQIDLEALTPTAEPPTG